MANIEDIEEGLELWRKNVYPCEPEENIIGITYAKISYFESTDSPGLRMNLILEWGEQHSYSMEFNDMISNQDGWFQSILDYLDTEYSNFKDIEGEKIPIGVRYFNINNGDIDTGTRINRDIIQFAAEKENKNESETKIDDLQDDEMSTLDDLFTEED